MKTRAITGFFFVIVMLASNLCGPYIFSAFYLILTTLCLHEFYKLIKQSGAAPSTYLGILNGVLLFGFSSFIHHNFYSRGHTQAIFLLLTFTISSIFIYELYKKTATPFLNIAYTLLGIILIVIPFSFFHGLGFITHRFSNTFPLGFLILLWANDTGAYLTGRWLGKTKLFERHSPKKTWEGFFGGVIISVGVALIINHFEEETWKEWVSIAILISCFGTLGDLVESMFKRSINVKDSGGVLPGHGGLLDRFDGLFLAAPMVFMYIYIFISSKYS